MKFLLALLVIVVVFVSGCTGFQEGFQEGFERGYSGDVQEEQAVTLGSIFVTAENWDADAENDGLEFTLFPKDADGDNVKVDGILNATLWRSTLSTQTFENVKVRIIKTWDSVQINKDDYDFVGVKVRLEFDEDYEPVGLQTGLLEIQLNTQGRSLKAESGVLLGL